MQNSAVQALLVINTGSSSLKFAIYELAESLQLLYRGQVTAIGADSWCRISDGDGQVRHEYAVTARDHEQAMQVFFTWLTGNAGALKIAMAGHRIVHGGTHYYEPTLLNNEVIADLRTLVSLAPNHQPPGLHGINALQQFQPGLQQVACFDTAFHHGRPEVEQRFALPLRPELEAVRRYGFHGLSYEYIATVLPNFLGAAADRRVIVAHLGHGASLCALHKRRSVATTMTFTPLDGIPMGTRCGAIDPAVVLYLLQQGMGAEEISELLYFGSGLLGVSGQSDDISELLNHPSAQSTLAIEQFIHHTVRAIGSLAGALQGLDALVFTAGIGTHAASVREAICSRCKWLGLDMDIDANQAGRACISHGGSPVQAWVIDTDEERMVATHTFGIFNKLQRGIPL